MEFEITRADCIHNYIVISDSCSQTDDFLILIRCFNLYLMLYSVFFAFVILIMILIIIITTKIKMIIRNISSLNDNNKKQ